MDQTESCLSGWKQLHPGTAGFVREATGKRITEISLRERSPSVLADTIIGQILEALELA
jgi:hypothetical protein